jgi:protein gp37
MSKIEWTDVTWNPVTGCDKVSQGCKNCYAEVMHRRLRGMFPEKYSQPFLGHIQLHASELRKPLKWKKPKMVFVNSMSDLFHPDVPFDFIDDVFAVMDCCPQHTFQILTKRPDRMAQYFAENRAWRVGQLKYAYDSSDYDLNGWPLENVWLGTSCEDQKTANERIPYLLLAPAAVRFLSCEPLLGPIDLSISYPYRSLQSQFDWIIVGGESGPKARPMHPDWVRSLRNQCIITGVPFFFKQWGAWMPGEQNITSLNQIASIDKGADVQLINHAGIHNNRVLIDGVTEPLTRMFKVGKHNSGNLLDGVQHLNFPTA